MIWVALATEDALSEAVGVKLISEHAGQLEVAQKLRRNGFGYLRSRLASFCEMARHQPVVVLTDLDKRPCAGALLDDWLGGRQCPQNLLLRVAVREIESWVLADHVAMRGLLNRPHQLLPDQTDGIDDPKRYLIDLARRAPRVIREAIVPERGAVATQGLGYNECLVKVVVDQWDPERASARSDSLRRARARLRELAALRL